MKTRVTVIALFVLMFAAAALAQKAQVVQQDKAIDVTKFRTFSYEVGHPAILKKVDERIIAGIEAQLVARGLTKAASGQGDVVFTYHSVQREDVDLSTFDEKTPAPGAMRTPAQTLKVGTLAVDLREASTRKLAWRAKVEDVLLRGDEAAQLAAIDKGIIAVFQVYPGSKPAK